MPIHPSCDRSAGMKPHIAIISPALAKANNGNWQTASRWARFLAGRYRLTIDTTWNDTHDSAGPDAMIALHARRSARAVIEFRAAYPLRPIVLVMTGTDIYRDIHTDVEAQRAMRLATTLIVLQAGALDELPLALRGKAHVIHQSAPTLRPAPRARPRFFDVIQIGHLRAEKDPMTFLQAARLVQSPRVRMLHVGGILEDAFHDAVKETLDLAPGYRWHGNLPHARTRQLLKRCALLAITSTMEGGANVIIEAVTSGVPVLASGISGNRGMLGDDYDGYFPLGDAAALARLIDRAEADQDFLELLRKQCTERARLFTPAGEQAALRDLMDNLTTQTEVRACA